MATTLNETIVEQNEQTERKLIPTLEKLIDALKHAPIAMLRGAQAAKSGAVAAGGMVATGAQNTVEGVKKLPGGEQLVSAGGRAAQGAKTAASYALGVPYYGAMAKTGAVGGAIGLGVGMQIGKMTSTAALVMKSAEMFGKALKASAGVARVAGTAMFRFGAVITGAVEAVSKFIAAWNPTALEHFQRSLQDLFAAFGSILEPIVHAGREYLGFLNQAVTSVAPQFNQILQTVGKAIVTYGGRFATIVGTILKALGPLFEELSKALIPLADSIGQLYQSLASILVEVIPLFTKLVQIVLPPFVWVIQRVSTSLQVFASIIAEVINRLSRGDLAGAADIRNVILAALDRVIESGSNTRPEGGQTTAARSANFSGIEEVSRSAILSAFRVGRSPEQIAQRAETQRDGMIAELVRIREQVRGTGSVGGGSNSSTTQQTINPTTWSGWSWANYAVFAANPLAGVAVYAARST